MIRVLAIAVVLLPAAAYVADRVADAFNDRLLTISDSAYRTGLAGGALWWAAAVYVAARVIA